MLDHITPIVNSAIDIELTYAQHDNGQTFHSPHEGYGVLAEELHEAAAEVSSADSWFETLLMTIQQNNCTGIIACAEHIERNARLAACEYIQVAAMARKLRLTMEGLEGEH